MPRVLFHIIELAAKRASRAMLRLAALITISWLFINVSIAGAKGPLRVNSNNPNYLFDQNGTAVYLAGTYLNEYNLLGGWDFTSYLDYLQQQNHNFTRIWGWEQSPWTFGNTGQLSFTVQPYERTGPGLALDGDLKFDLTRFNQAYFDQLRSRVMEAGRRGIYVSVMIFEGFSNQKRVRQVNPWLGDPFEQDNNINGVNGDPNQNGGGEEFFSLGYPSLVSLQEAFVRKIVDTLNDLDNVLYEINANGSSQSLAWQYHMIDYLKSYESAKEKQHPVGISQFYSGSIAEVLASAADWVVLQATNLNPMVANSSKVVFLDADPNLFTSTSSHQWVWKNFARGYNLTYLEPSVPNAQINDVHVALGQSVAYAQLLDLASLFTGDSCSTGYCLANPGGEYVAYLPAGGRITFDLSSSRQQFVPSWFDPATGKIMTGSSVSGGGKTVLTSPIKGESMVQLDTQLAAPALAQTGSANNASDPTSKASWSTARSTAQVAAPVITPNGGIYSGTVSVSLQTTTSKAVIYYTTNGQAVTESSNRYSKPFVLSTSTLVKAKAFRSGYAASGESSAWFTNSNSTSSSFNFMLANSGDLSVVPGSSIANTIAATLSSGTAQTVSFSVIGLPAGATASFSSLSCNPTCSTTLNITTTASTAVGNYPVTITAAGGALTRTTSFTLTILSAPAVATPIITPNGGTYNGSVSVTIQTATAGASIYYTTDGSAPTQLSKLYGGAIALTSSTIVRAQAFKSGYTGSTEASASFTINQTSLSSGLVGYWKFDEGTGLTAADSSGNGNTGNLTNGTQWSAGLIGNALYFDGVNDSVTVPDANSLDLSSSFTFSAWVNPATALNDFRAVLVKNYTYYLYSSVSGYCGAGASVGGFSAGAVNNIACALPALPIKAWSHLTLTYDSSTLTFYLNGVAVATAAASGAPSPTVGTLQIGASQYGEYFQGFIDEVRVYNRALSATEIAAIYQQDSVLAASQPVATPIVSPSGGSFAGSASVQLGTATAGASIYYTTDGSLPSQSSALYTGTIMLATSTTIKAKAFKNGYTASGEADAAFTVIQPFDFSLAGSVNQSMAAGTSASGSITASLASGGSQPIAFSISGLPTGATASFTPSTCSPACSTVLNIVTAGSTTAGTYPITVSATGGGVTRTTAFTLGVTLALTVATPTITPNGGNFSGSTSVTIQTATSGASIYYSADGSTPTQSSTLYTGPFTLTSNSTINARAFKSGYVSSAIASASFANAGTGRTYYVAKTGNDSNACSSAAPCLSINKAIGMLASGDTLIIRAGVYNESINNNVPSGSAWSAPTTIKSYPGDAVTLQPPSDYRVIYLGDNKKFIVFDGLVLDGINLSHSAGGEAVKLGYDTIVANAANNIRITNCEIKNAPSQGILSFGTGHQFVGNKIHDNGFFCGGAGNCHGIYHEGDNAIIERNDVYNNEGFGIHIFNGYDYASASSNVLRFNRVHDNGKGGVAGVSSYTSGIIITSGAGNKAYNNLIWNNKQGIRADYGATNTLIYNNTIYNNRLNGSGGAPGSCVYNGQGASYTSIRNNICWQNDSAILDVSAAPGVSSNNLTTSDPLFFSAAAADFHLQRGSPAIDSAATLSEVTNDMDGVSRPQGSGYDSGAYEFVSGQ